MRTFDRWLNRTLHMASGVLFLCVASFLSFTAGDWRWPYDTVHRELMTPEVQPGGYLIMRRVIHYHEGDDCDILYERRIQSEADGGRRHMAPDISFEHPPWDMNDKPQEQAVEIPHNFPCGSAYLVESVSAACTWVQRIIRRQRKDDIRTPFNVTGCP